MGCENRRGRPLEWSFRRCVGVRYTNGLAGVDTIVIALNCAMTILARQTVLFRLQPHEMAHGELSLVAAASPEVDSSAALPRTQKRVGGVQCGEAVKFELRATCRLSTLQKHGVGVRFEVWDAILLLQKY
jgi:hypothetical protein